MRVFTDFDNFPFTRTVVSVGSYDGVHRGHRMLLERLAEEADKREAEPVVFTFSPHPKKVLGFSNGFLTTPEEQLLLFQEVGVRNVMMVPFTHELSMMSPESFARNILCGKLHAVAAVMGSDHTFGKDGKGKSETLSAAGIDSICVDLLDSIGSTGIRSLLRSGEVDKACSLLGGDGYLILNPVTDPTKIMPPSGRYEALVDGQLTEVKIPELPEGKIVRILKPIKDESHYSERL